MIRHRLLLAGFCVLAGIGLYLALATDDSGRSPAAPTALMPVPDEVRPATDPVGAGLIDEPDRSESAATVSASSLTNGSSAPPPLLPGLHAAPSAREALMLIARQPEGPDSVGFQRDVERLCLRARRDGRRRREAQSPESWYLLHLEQRREWCNDLPAVEGDPDSVERALLALGPDRGDLLREQLGRSPGDSGAATARRALAQSRDLYELTAALQHLDTLGALGVPPYSLRDDLPAQLSDLAGVAAQWTLCAELGPCGPRSWPVLRYCAERNSCPPEVDFYTAVRYSLGATQFEQLQWLTRRIAAERAQVRRGA